jgi:hypothetical protein
MHRPTLHLSLVAVALLLATTVVPQDAEAQRARTNISANLGGDFSFGNRDQTNFSTRGGISRADSLFESSTSFRYNYQTRTNDEGETRVSRRAWTADAELSFRPRERWQPVVTGEVHSSYERRIALRYDTGAGVKMSHQDPDNPRRNRIDVSLTVLAERTYARERSGGAALDGVDVSLTRWSGNIRVRRDVLGDRFSIDSRNSYRPVFDSFGRFRVQSINSIDYSLTDTFVLGFEVRTNFDSTAKERGANKNYDGYTEISLGARF